MATELIIRCGKLSNMYDRPYIGKGFFAYLFEVLSELDFWEKELGPLKPYIELTPHKNYAIPYYEAARGSNVWDYYFEQERVSEDAKVTRGMEHYNYGYKKKGTIDQGSELFDRFRELVHKYIFPKAHIMKIVNEFYDKHMEGKRVVGLQKRGTTHLLKGHGRGLQGQMTFKFYIDKLRGHLKHYDGFLLLTDEQDTVEVFRSKYPNDLIHYDSACLSRSGGEQIQFGGGQVPPYKRGEDVLVEALLATRVDKWLAVSSNVSSGIITLADDGFDYEYIDKEFFYRG